jgi:DNA mismatch repair protein MutL
MTDVIRLLPDSIANQIAAGEVVQRPASVVKELLENSVDAGATQVQLVVKDAGKTLVQVIDNGAGMSETDARMSFERHATSKIRTSDDLFRIRTMGFRGEALASIAAVAQVELRTRRAADELGTRVCIEGSEVKAQEPVAGPVGTNLCVKNLFFNVPARRNFLKSNPVEMRHVIDEFQRVALANPEIAFSLYHNDAEVYTLPAGKLSRRIVDLFGKTYREQLAPCREETPFVSVTGYVGKPEFAKKVRGEQFFFVNNRYVRHNYLHHAVLSAFEGLIAESSHPFYVLFIEIDPAHIDINVHPTKTEIKFDDERSVYAIVRAAVKKSTGVYNLAPSLDFELDVNSPFLGGGGSFGPSATVAPAPVAPPPPERRTIPATPHLPEKTASQRQHNLSNWSRLFDGMENRSFERDRFLNRLHIPDEEPTPPAPAPTSLTLQSKANRLAAVQTEAFDLEAPPFQLHNRFVVAQVRAGVLLIDQRAAYERILHDKYRSLLDRRNGASQALLFPKALSLSPADAALVRDLHAEIQALGFEFSEVGKNDFLIQGVPADLGEENELELFEGMLEQYKLHQTDLRLDKPERLARSVARRSASRYAQRLSTDELKALIDQLFASSNPHYTPGGEPTMGLLGLEKLAGLLK